MFHILHRRTLTLAALLAFAMTAHAGNPVAQADDLGQSWPRAQNLSLSAGWNVYVFTRGSIHFVQVNDSSGNVHAAFAVAGDQVLALPIGSDAQRVSTPQQPLAAVSTANGQVIYSDLQLQVVMVPQADGSAWNVVPTPQTTSNAAAAQSSGASACTRRECGGDLNSLSTPVTVQP
jgi:hypothetical protein